MRFSSSEDKMALKIDKICFFFRTILGSCPNLNQRNYGTYKIGNKVCNTTVDKAY